MRPNLKNLHVIFRGLWLSIIIAPMLSACSASAPAPTDKKDLFLVQPFRTDGSDEHVRFEFEATPENINITQSYIVGLTLSRKGPFDPVTMLNHGEPPLRYALKVEACKWTGDQCLKIKTEDAFQEYIREEPSRSEFFEWRKGKDDVKYIDIGAHTSDVSQWVVCRLPLENYGRYRIDISAQPGNPELKDPTAQISIQKRWTSSK
ncbi:hypothetical protein [Xanthomonas vesicatoria]|uniref:DUF5625 domain-containing protein n=1 Tax=Xanthomonas vesicatoria TaxID=56460 RepID=A0ABS8LDX0_9XANT|nr:hypothetical protein [Xanthomonas vesicatoria]MCC8605291.1 hypothetical protein [Xanthomonas vesicatoria]MCC8623950.1 hypothetical protein [Xanthomonas vesicatoria]MCC8627218.1 hypothetical protein [Xanthomonas vesicatoria]MCC8695651.1 hypothetical protein [Xanthomonas vesicatoria]MCC8701527.1 hypothetical protein [Xanthomonas vesicatoria]